MSPLKFSWKRSLPSILQTEKSECGLACVAMILNFHGHRIDINTLRRKYSVSQQGITLKSLMALADKVHLACRPLKLELEEIPKLKTPAILHWDINHFTVLAGMKGSKYLIHDPAVGVRLYTEDTLSKHFTGVALELVPSEAFKEKAEERKLGFSDLWSRASGLKQSFIQMFILSLLMQGFALALPFYTQTVIDDVLVRFDLDLLKILALGFLLVTLLNVVTDLIRSYTVLHLGNSLGFQLAANVNRHLLKLPLEYFNKRHMGDIVSRFGSIHKIRDFITSGIIEAVMDGIMVIGTLVLILVYSLKLSALVIGILILNSILKFSFFRVLRRENEELIVASASENTTFMENVRSIQGIKLFNKELERNSVWQNIFADMTNKGINVQKWNIFVRISRSLVFGVENIVIVLLAAYTVIDGALSIGMVIAFLSYKDQLYRRFFGLIDKYFDFKMLDIHLMRLADIAFSKPEEQNSGIPAITTPPARSSNLLELKNVGFRYAEESPFLFQNINLQVKEKESIAIIGPTGCGKSTLLRLILGLYQPTAGPISLYGTPIGTLGLENYRNHVSGVLQDDILLSGSIFENISFFDPTPDRDRVEQSAIQAAIAPEIERMPMGYETLVGNMGAALSGGQVQRILLARSFYRSCKLLVLDEATSYLDLKTEMLVNQAIRSLTMARIMVAHRPQSFLLADRIYRLTRTGLIQIEKEAIQASLNANQKEPASMQQIGG